jgi:hypothetical protein
MKAVHARYGSNAELVVGIGLVLLGVMGVGTAHTFGGLLYVALPVGFIIVAVGLANRRGRHQG